jgi:hypothetical protein
MVCVLVCGPAMGSVCLCSCSRMITKPWFRCRSFGGCGTGTALVPIPLFPVLLPAPRRGRGAPAQRGRSRVAPAPGAQPATPANPFSPKFCRRRRNLLVNRFSSCQTGGCCGFMAKLHCSLCGRNVAEGRNRACGRHAERHRGALPEIADRRVGISLSLDAPGSCLARRLAAPGRRCVPELRYRSHEPARRRVFHLTDAHAKLQNFVPSKQNRNLRLRTQRLK